MARLAEKRRTATMRGYTLGLAAILIPAGSFEIEEHPVEIPRALPPSESSAPDPFPFPDANLAASLAGLQDRIEAMAAEVEQAKKGTGKEDEFGRFARQSVNFLDGLDRILTLSRAKEQSEEVKAWLGSVQALNDRVIRLFGNFDLTMTDDTGTEVDLSRHEVVEYRKTNDYPHNTVIEVLQKGIMFRGRMLRDARVIVACNEDQ